MNLLIKGRKLREVLQKNEEVTGCSNLSDTMSLNDSPIKIFDEDSAKNRILQWQRQGLQCDKIIIAAESYQLLHLVSLVKIYEEVFYVGERLSQDPKSNIKNVKKWVIKFVRTVLNINTKAEQRNRLGCDRLQNLFDKGVTCTQLVLAGCWKCDFFVKKEYYELFLSQLNSLGSSSSSIFEILEDKPDDASSRKKKKSCM